MNARVRDLSLHPAAFIEADATRSSAPPARCAKSKVNALFVRDGRARRHRHRHGSVAGGDPRAPADRDERRRPGPIRSRLGRARRLRLDGAAEDDQAQQAPRRGDRERRICRHSRGHRPPELPGRQFAARRRPHRPRRERAPTSPSAAREIEGQTRMLRRQGVKIEVVCEIVSDLNRRLFAKLFAMTASPAIRDDGCLIVMGSEGRGEQTFRTDQDNGLILSTPAPERRIAGVPRRLFRGAGELRLSALPWRRDGRQSAMVEDDRGLSRRLPPLARLARRTRAYERRDLLRRRGGRGRRASCCAGPSWS